MLPRAGELRPRMRFRRLEAWAAITTRALPKEFQSAASCRRAGDAHLAQGPLARREYFAVVRLTRGGRTVSFRGNTLRPAPGSRNGRAQLPIAPARGSRVHGDPGENSAPVGGHPGSTPHRQPLTAPQISFENAGPTPSPSPSPTLRRRAGEGPFFSSSWDDRQVIGTPESKCRPRSWFHALALGDHPRAADCHRHTSGARD